MEQWGAEEGRRSDGAHSPPPAVDLLTENPPLSALWKKARVVGHERVFIGFTKILAASNRILIAFIRISIGAEQVLPYYRD